MTKSQQNLQKTINVKMYTESCPMTDDDGRAGRIGNGILVMSLPRRLSPEQKSLFDLKYPLGAHLKMCPVCGAEGLVKYTKNGRYFYPYVYHYNSKSFKEKYADYKNGLIGRPSGTERHPYRWYFQDDLRYGPVPSSFIPARNVTLMPNPEFKKKREEKKKFKERRMD